MSAEFRLPTNKQRVAVIGRTGSGKTQFAAWLLSVAPFDKQPYFIVDYKYDDLLNGSDRIKEIGLTEKLPKQPGLYIVHPHPDQHEDTERFLLRIWEQEHAGLYADEGYMLPPRSPAFQALLTQGRSKRIPAIVLTQRPTWVSRFVFSEADYYAIFHLNDARDRQTIQAFTPRERLDVSDRLPDYHSMWYDVGRDNVFQLKPVPEAAEILERIDSRLGPKARKL